jgi:hypothetical protein
VFIPTHYEVSIETEARVLDIAADTVSAYAASGIRDVPDSPPIILDRERLDGTVGEDDQGVGSARAVGFAGGGVDDGDVEVFTAVALSVVD